MIIYCICVLKVRRYIVGKLIIRQQLGDAVQAHLTSVPQIPRETAALLVIFLLCLSLWLHNSPVNTAHTEVLLTSVSQSAKYWEHWENYYLLVCILAVTSGYSSIHSGQVTVPHRASVVPCGNCGSCLST